MRWPARLHCVGKHPRIVLDCAHAPDAAAALVDSLKSYFRYQRLWFVVGMSEDKDVAGFARQLSRVDAETLLCQARLPRALPAHQLRERAKPFWDEAECFNSTEQAVRAARERAGRDDLICITGSVYVVGEAMESLGIEPF